MKRITAGSCCGSLEYSHSAIKRSIAPFSSPTKTTSLLTLRGRDSNALYMNSLQTFPYLERSAITKYKTNSNL